MNRLLRHEHGQILALFGIGLVVLMGFMALAVDVGMLWSDRREMQTAADAAAEAGAVALRQGNNVTTAARDAAGLNSFTNGAVVDGNSISVAVNNPPTSGPYSGNANYVEAIVEQPQATYFLRALGYNTVDVSTRAVSGYVNGPGCVISLNPSANSAITVSGSASITAPKCNVVDDSNASSSALNGSGSASITANAIGVVGGYTSATYSPTPKTGIAPLPDPLSNLAAPTIGAVPAACNTATRAEHGYSATGGETINPGVYCGGITVSGGKSLNLSPGLYILYGGGLTVSASTLRGTGVSFFNTGTASGNTQYKAINISGGSIANLSAPTSQLTGVTGGPWEGILFFQDRGICAGTSFCDAAGSTSGNQNTVSGASGAAFQGVLYFPNTPVVYSGGSSGTGYTVLIADAITVSGPSSFGSDFSSLADGSPIKTSALYE
jgi:Flp pilus assembly protein TadG